MGSDEFSVTFVEASNSVLPMGSIAVFMAGPGTDDVIGPPAVVSLETEGSGNGVTVSTDSWVVPDIAIALLAISRLLKVTSVPVVTVISAAV